MACCIYLFTSSSVHPIVTYSRVQMFEKGDLSNRHKMNGCSFHYILLQNLSWLLSQCGKTLIIGGFILKPTEIRARFFQNSPQFERSACFYMTITGNFECFQYFNFETNFLKNEIFFQKTGVPFFS